MPTFQQVSAEVEKQTKAAMDALGFGTVFANTADNFITGQVAYCKVTVIEQTDKQTVLGIPESSRIRGTATFLLHTRKNSGMGKNTQMREAIKARFRNKVVGGANFLEARATFLGETENWSLTGVEVPFYFDR